MDAQRRDTLVSIQLSQRTQDAALIGVRKTSQVFQKLER